MAFAAPDVRRSGAGPVCGMAARPSRSSAVCVSSTSSRALHGKKPLSARDAAARTFGQAQLRSTTSIFSSAVRTFFTVASASSSVSVRSDARSTRLYARLFLPAAMCSPV